MTTAPATSRTMACYLQSDTRAHLRPAILATFCRRPSTLPTTYQHFSGTLPTPSACI